MKADEAILKVKKTLTKERFEHTLRVAKIAKKLAILNNESPERAELAAIFHDYAKDHTKGRLREMIQKYSLPKDLLMYDQELWHAPVGAMLVQENHDVTDPDILHAIRYHTTGRKHMSQLELIVFLADYIEPNRHFKGIQEVRNQAQNNLLKASWMALRNSIQFLMQKKVLIYPDTFYAYNDLTRRLSF